MKLSKRIVSYTLGILVLVFILNEIGIIKLNLYHNKELCHIDSSWSNSGGSYTTGDANDSTKEIELPKASIVVVYKTLKVGDLTSENPTVIDVSDKDLGSYWVPLFKKSNFIFTVNYRDTIVTDTETFHSKKCYRGEINISGHYRIIGLCSTEVATKLIVEKILYKIYTNAQKNIN
jgi:hypothetical protein